MTQFAYDVVHYYNIKVVDDKRTIVESKCWKGLRWELRIKYDWYFKYRAALFQVKYPRYDVNCFWGHEPAEGKTLKQILQSKISAKKRKITEYKNKLEAGKKEWNSLFSIEDDPDYKRVVDKINKLELELQEFVKTVSD
jgi:hypothetical protein